MWCLYLTEKICSYDTCVVNAQLTSPPSLRNRQYVRVVDGTPVDFHRYSYEFVNPAAASLAGLGVAPQTDTNANSTTSPFPTPTVFHPSLSPEVEHQSSPLKVEQLEEDDETLEQVTPTKINPSKKRRNSFRWTPSKKAKARKIRSSQAFDNEVVVDNGRECTEYPLHRVLVHYLGNSDAESAPSAIKKRSARLVLVIPALGCAMLPTMGCAMLSTFACVMLSTFVRVRHVIYFCVCAPCCLLLCVCAPCCLLLCVCAPCCLLLCVRHVAYFCVLPC